MADEERYSLEEAHKKFAVDCFNGVWNLLEKKDRTAEEDDEMMHAAHASRYHWGQIGTPVHKERGEWQISRVYVVLNRPKSALFHAQKCLDICEDQEIGDFDIAFAHEAMARAHAASGNKAEFEKHFGLAKKAADEIGGEEDKKVFFGELESGPWYGMR
jgi:hypothetical protein